MRLNWSLPIDFLPRIEMASDRYVLINGEKIRGFGAIDYSTNVLLRYASAKGHDVSHMRVITEVMQGSGIKAVLSEMTVRYLQDDVDLLPEGTLRSEGLRRMRFLYPNADVTSIEKLLSGEQITADPDRLRIQKERAKLSMEVLSDAVERRSLSTSLVKSFEVINSSSIFRLVGAEHMSLRQLFELCVPTPDVPFVMLSVEGSESFMVHGEGPIPDASWLRGVPFGLTIVTTFGGVLTTVVMYPTEATVINSPNDVLVMKHVLEKLFSSKLTISSVSPQSAGIRFMLPTPRWSRIVMGEIIRNDPFVSRLMYINEKNQTFLKKKGSNIFYDPSYNVDPDKVDFRAVKFITHREKRGYIYTVSRLPSINAGLAFINVLLRVLYTYDQRREEILLQYQELTRAYVEYESNVLKQEIHTEGESNERRIVALQQFDRQMFHGRYAAKCQSKRQPILIENGRKLSSKEIRSIVRKRYDGNDHKVMEFPQDSGVWFGCQRDEQDTFEFKWPGLNKPACVQGSNSFTPCCFKEDQYQKNTGLSLYLNPKRKSVSSYIKMQNKKICEGEMAKPPFLIQRMLNLNKDELTTVQQGKTEVVSIVRMGVRISTHSILDCLEKTRSKPSKTPRQRIRKLLTEELVACASQELMGATLSDLYTELDDEQTTIDPRKWFSILEELYECTIFLFYFSKADKPDGELILPRSQLPYVFRPRVKDRRCCVILLRPEEDLPPYLWSVDYRASDLRRMERKFEPGVQCEILADVVRRSRPNFDFSGTSFERTLFDSRESIRSLYTLTRDTYSKSNT